MKKVLVVFGTRPEAIKMCPLVNELKKRKEIECLVCLTGQHKEMVQEVMEIFGIKEDYNLNIMQPEQTLCNMTIRILKSFERIVMKVKPNLVLVHGDTTTAFSSAIVAFYSRIPIGHVEAGLRTHYITTPYPEEFNRQVVDLVSDLYFAPTKRAEQNLLSEGKDRGKIFVTGNTVIDTLSDTVNDNYHNQILDWVEDSRMILFTAHRRENIGIPMRNMFRAILKILEEVPDVKVVYPVHKNPKVRKIVQELLRDNARIKVVEPFNIIDFHNLMNKSYLIMTDSGGIQEEASALNIPVLVMRDTTERQEGVETGILKLVGTDEKKICDVTCKLLKDIKLYDSMRKSVNPYGDGNASKKIVDIIFNFFEEKME